MCARHRSTAARVVLLTLAAGLAVGGCSRTPSPPPGFVPTRAIYTLSEAEKGALSKANYDKIKEGMTRDEVRAVFGTSGPNATPRTDKDEYELVWKYGEKEIAVRFRGERSISKSQVGVEP